MRVPVCVYGVGESDFGASRRRRRGEERGREVLHSIYIRIFPTVTAVIRAIKRIISLAVQSARGSDFDR